VIVSEEHLGRLLGAVQKPGRYAGGEWNSVIKDWKRTRVAIALGYPDIYDIGMSNAGLSILYQLVNQREDMVAERIYAPWDDMESVMRENGIPLFSLETRRSMNEFDLVGLSLQHELCYATVLNMLDLAAVPLLASERGLDDPLVIAGGSCTYNPEPMADFFDLFALGEGEELLIEIMDALAEIKEKHPQASRRAKLRRLAQIDGVYVPAFYAPEYAEDGRYLRLRPTDEAVAAVVHKRIVDRLPTTTKPVVPHIQTVHDRAVIEIQRGCSRGCRFCQAGVIYRPIRERPVDETLSVIDATLRSTGYDEVGLLSLSSSDHSGIQEIVREAIDRFGPDGVGVSLPSLRIDSFSVKLAETIQKTRKTGFTFAPEAGTQRLRDVINKGVTEEDLFAAASAAFESGWNRLKLYFMIGLPTETDEDVLGIARLVLALRDLGRTIRNRPVDIRVSVSTLVPKPHTPFQWVPLADRATVEHRQALLRGAIRDRRIKLSWSSWDSTWLEAILCRGDRRLSEVILRAWESGARFDAWREHFHPLIWQEAFADSGIDADAYAYREYGESDALPWDHIDTGVTRAFLRIEYDKAQNGELSPDCREHCHNCGVLEAYADERTPASAWGCP